MAGPDIWWTYWYFHLPNYVLSLLFYTLFGRLALGLFLPAHARTGTSPNYIYRWFCRLTDWLLPPVRFITPAQLHGHLLLPVAAFWVVVVRVALFAALYSAGLLPRAPGGGL
jgi:YggT family protein